MYSDERNKRNKKKKNIIKKPLAKISPGMSAQV